MLNGNRRLLLTKLFPYVGKGVGVNRGNSRCVAIVFGALLTYTGVKKKIRIGSVVSILFSVAAFGSTFGGLLIGLVLVIVGNVLALLWKPKKMPAPPARD